MYSPGFWMLGASVQMSVARGRSRRAHAHPHVGVATPVSGTSVAQIMLPRSAYPWRVLCTHGVSYGLCCPEARRQPCIQWRRCGGAQ